MAGFSVRFHTPFKHMHMLNKKIALSLIGALFFLSVFSQNTKPATISGTIKDAKTKQPLIEAVITLSSSAFTGQKFAVTDSSGNYKINNLPDGNYTIAFEMEGYEKFVHQNFALKQGMAVGMNYQMVKESKRKNKDKQQNSDSTYLQVKIIE